MKELFTAETDNRAACIPPILGLAFFFFSIFNYICYATWCYPFKTLISCENASVHYCCFETAKMLK